MRTLGARTGELHVALAKRTGDPAFEPEPITPEDLAAWTEQVRRDGARTLELLAGCLDKLPEATRQDAEAMIAARGELMARIDTLGAEPVTADKSRYHGDYHLGQVLLAAHDFVIVDFEGEPSRPLAARRAKHSPLRDVAGMLRSFGYASAVALQQATADRPDARARLLPALTAWHRDSSRAFLAAYAEAMRGCASFPSDPAEARRLIVLFMIEKALYEVRYELGSRPDWLRIPIAGLLELIAAEPAGS
jgi:maltose alpha-D-glucosyltransferase/alpha-amylase